MRLAKSIETKGLFWLPGKPDTQLSGVLSISELAEVTVELTGTFHNPFVSPTGDMGTLGPVRIVGGLQEGGPTTLDGCHLRKTNTSFSGGLSTSIFDVECAFVGAAYDEQEKPMFSNLYFSVEGLDTWLSISGIEPELDISSNSGLIRYHRPDDISVNVAWDRELRFIFGMTFPSISWLITEASVKQNAYVSIKLKDPRPVTYFSRQAVKLCNFLSLALDQAVGIQSITGYLYRDSMDTPKHPRPVQVYGQFAHTPERKPKIRLQDILFRYPDVASELSSMMIKWFECHDTFKPAFNLYFASKAQPSQFLEAKVLWLTQALETLHRRSSSEKRSPEEEFDSLYHSLLENCPMNRRAWLKEELRYANELSLRQRIKRLLIPFENWFGVRKRREAFVNTVCDTRNYFTHYDETNTKDRAITGHELFELHGKLEALFQLHLLKLIGLDDSAIDSIVKGNRVLRRKLGV